MHHFTRKAAVAVGLSLALTAILPSGAATVTRDSVSRAAERLRVP